MDMSVGRPNVLEGDGVASTSAAGATKDGTGEARWGITRRYPRIVELVPADGVAHGKERVRPIDQEFHVAVSLRAGTLFHLEREYASHFVRAAVSADRARK